MSAAEMFPIFGGLSDENFRRMGYRPVRVSVFDHWLTEEELVASKILTFNSAVDCFDHAGDVETLEQYFVGERSFKALYNEFSNSTEVYEDVDGETALVDGEGSFELTLTLSLREQRLMDLYFVGPQIRVLGGSDRTDLLLVRSELAEIAVKRAVERHGLHVLP